MAIHDLPVEVLTDILASVSSLSDLRALVTTSQHIYSVFQRNKAALIYLVLSTELGPVSSDALAFSHMDHLNALSSSYYKQVEDAVLMYGGYLAGRKQPSRWEVSIDYVLLDHTELHQVMSVAAFLRRLRRYFHMTHIDRPRQSWQDIVDGPNSTELSPLMSVIETVRAAEEAVWQESLLKSSGLEFSARLVGDWKGFNTRWPETAAHSYRMATFPHERYGYPAGLRFDGDGVTAVPLAWVDAFDGQYTYDFIGRQFAIWEAGRLPERVLWRRLGFVMWDATRIAALKKSPSLSHYTTGWASLSTQ
ncbi:hypothetical protein MFIFM68171_05583 [Madurella fahalii]|uniref:F-box domain-containing protein n=1 Tax=Madurella fahalii TaxID=1157608 RepID=A0ABQ0GC77_9PEZI